MVYLTVGLPGSGKTTWARNFQARNGALIVSKDAIRHMYGVEFDWDLEPQVSRLFWALLHEALRTYGNIIVDNTNLTREVRSKIIRAARDAGHRTEIHEFRGDPDASWRRKRATGSAMQVEDFDRLLKSYDPVLSGEEADVVITHYGGIS